MSAKTHQKILLASLDATFFSLVTLSYLYSPAHWLPFLLRLVTQLNLDPSRTLRRSLLFVFVVNVFALVTHAAQGSRGTRARGWTNSGLLIDFIGQSFAPSRLVFAQLDVAITFVQLTMVIVTYVHADPEQYVALVAPGFATGAGDEDELNAPILDISFKALYYHLTKGSSVPLGDAVV